MEKIKETIKRILGINYGLMEEAQKRLDSLTKPQGSLGYLEEIAKLIVGITGKEDPVLQNKVIFTLAGDHGIVEEGVSAYPKEVTPQMVYNFLRGGAGINVLARHVGARVVVVDMGIACEIQKSKIKNQNFKNKKIGFGTKNMTKGPAMTRDEAIKSIETGIDVFEEEYSAQGAQPAGGQGSASGGEKGVDIIGTGDMGIGNTTPSSAISAVFTGRNVEDVTGRGTGINESSFKNKVNLIRKAIELNKPDPKDPIDVLSKVGGFEIGGLSGVIIGAASRRIPVVIDGFISGAAALTAYHLEPKVKDYMFAGHCSVEKGHKIVLEHLRLKPILDLNLRLGEGTGAALSMNIIEAAVKILAEMATFKSANVSQKVEEQSTEPVEL